MTQGATSVSSFFTCLKGAWDELNSHMTIPKCTCDATMAWQAERDKEKVHQFLMGLNDSFKTLRSQIMAMEPLPILNRIYSMVVMEEKQLSITQPQEMESAGALTVQNQPNVIVGRFQPNAPVNHSKGSRPRP